MQHGELRGADKDHAHEQSRRARGDRLHVAAIQGTNTTIIYLTIEGFHDFTNRMSFSDECRVE